MSLELTSDDEVRPAGRVLEVDALKSQAGSVLSIEQDGPQILVGGIEDLQAGELVPPPLAIAVEHAAAVDLDVLAAPLPEHQAVLEGVVEGIGLPVRGVVGEFDFAIQLDVDVVQEGQVQRLADHEGFALGEEQSTAIVCVLETL